MCPSHLNLLILMLRTRSKLHDELLASCGIVLSVKRDSILLLAPLIFFIAAGVNLHVSHPYVKTEHTAALYSRNLMVIGNSGESKT